MRSVRSVLIFTNPRAGAGRQRGVVPLLAETLRGHGLTVRVTDQVKTLASLASPAGCGGDLPVDLVIAAGGDGTLGLVMDQTPPETVIAILPLGTENLVAKHFGLTAEVDAMVQTVIAGRMQVVDAGVANGKLFLVMLTCGFDAEVVAEMHQGRSGHIRRWSYLGPIARVLARYRFPELTVRSGQSELTGRWAMVFNLPRYAMGLAIEPQADGHDGQLNLCVFPRGSIFSGLRYLLGIVLGYQRWGRDIERQPIRTCTITAAVPVAFQIDGDPGGQLPVTVEVLPGRVRLRLPESHPAPSEGRAG